MARGKPLAVGDSVRSLCTRCKTATRHVAVSVVAGRAAKVQCTVCQGFHNYRDPEPPSKASSSAGRPAGRGTAAARTLEGEWLALMRGRDPKEAIPYPAVLRPKPGDLVEHPVFGFGLVRKVIPPNKVEIHFRDGIRLLRWEA